jgi:hypothetical protein
MQSQTSSETIGHTITIDISHPALDHMLPVAPL